jgi:hypothetical protein
MKEKIRKIIRQILNENEFLFEIRIKKRQPQEFKLFKLSDKEHQYGFQTKNGNTYYLSIFKTCIRINEQGIIDLYDKEIKEDGCLYFNALNFVQGDDNPNDKKSFEKLTGMNEQFALMGNILWLLSEFIKTNNGEKYFIASAEPKRMAFYQDAFKNIEDEFYVFPPKMYDIGYKENQMILIKK